MANFLLNCWGCQPDLLSIEQTNQDLNYGVPVLKVLAIDACAKAILDYVPIKDLVRSERVCRKWQSALHEYMNSIHNISFYDLLGRDLTKLAIESGHRKIQIRADAYPVSFACRIIKKWGYSIVNIFTVRLHKKYFEVICLKCKFLRCIKFVGHRKILQYIFNEILPFSEEKQRRKQQNFPLNKINKCKQLKKMGFTQIFDLGDDDMGILLQNVDLEELEICNIRLYGDCLKSVKPHGLKSLNVSSMWHDFHVEQLLYATIKMRNLKSLTLNNNNLDILINLHLILKEMTELETLSLCQYKVVLEMFDVQWDNFYYASAFIEGLGRLENLKHVSLRANETVDDEMLEALARCRHLEYLDISNDCNHFTFWSARGVSALCRRPAVTTLCLGFVYKMSYSGLLASIWKIKKPLVQELKRMGCVKILQKWLKTASEGSMVARYPLELKAIRPAVTEECYPDLKIVLSAALHRQSYSSSELY